MRNNRLPLIAVILVAIGVSGVFVTTTLFGGPRNCRAASSMPGMMNMMDGGMMGRGMMDREQMRDMMQRMMPGMLPPPGIKPENLPNPESRGAKLLDRYCAQCHYLPNPAMHTAEEWPQIAGRMFSRMSMMSGMMGVENPASEERREIIAYLKAHSMRSISPGSLPSPESRGALLFKEICSQCHSLPDPKLHTAEEWRAVVERMRNNMKIMGRRVATEEEKREIVDYLARNSKK